MDPKLVEIQKLLDAADGNLSSARAMVKELTGSDAAPLDIDTKLENLTPAEGKVIEGVFDGEMMVAADGKTYPVPPNYASKSKLVEGDTLKLTIADDGSFVFKQIAPVERRNAIGTLALDNGNYTISAEGKSYKVLTASVTFYKANPGDQVTIILPKEHDAVWAVMENVVPKTEVVAEPEVVIPEPSDSTPVDQPASEPVSPMVSTEPEPEVTTPEIEFPGGAPAISDEQLLENLKSNLQKIDQPAFTPPENAASKPVDNIVANDLANISKQGATNSQPTSDTPIAELDI